MFDSLTNSADGLFILFFIIALVVFFLFGPHKVYESLFWCLLGIGLYLFIHELTFVFPEITRTVFLGNWIVENRGSLLWIAKILALLLFFITPMTLGLNVSGVVRWTAWFFIKTLILSVIFIIFGIAFFSLLSNGSGILGEVTIIPTPLKDIPYFKNSYVYLWIADKSALVVLLGFLLGFYKILFSHWVNRIFITAGLMFAKSNEIFGKKSYDTTVPLASTHDETHDDSGHENV